MANKLSIQEYYYQQRRIAETYGVSDNHAGCYVCKYPGHAVCFKCRDAEKCQEILEKELSKRA